MYSIRTQSLGNQTTHHQLYQNDRQLTFEEVANLWADSQSFREFYIQILRDSPYAAFFWEAPPVTKDTFNRPYEFVLVESGMLARVGPEPNTFAEHFEKPSTYEGIIAFSNLGGDARLVVPKPLGDHSIYPHLANFVRNAPESQVHELFRAVSENLQKRLSSQPVWLSTAGMGVFWVHVRLDSRPKYYRHQPYKLR